MSEVEKKYEAALKEIVRVCTSGPSLGVDKLGIVYRIAGDAVGYPDVSQAPLPNLGNAARGGGIIGHIPVPDGRLL